MMSRMYLKKIVSEEDFKFFLKLSLNEKIMNMNYGRVFTAEETKIVYKIMLDGGKKHEAFGSFKVFDIESNDFIGICTSNINDNFTEVELEYEFLPEYWGKGYGTEVVGMLVNKAEQFQSVRKVTAIIDSNNIGSKRVLLKNKFEVQGTAINPDDGSTVEILARKVEHNL